MLNSAGYALVGAIEEAKLEDVKAEFATTFFGRHRAGAVGNHKALPNRLMNLPHIYKRTGTTNSASPYLLVVKRE
ncbi:hypothetical protein FHX10_006584 [Rhizobium sp. BK591]|uniref:hypothetical protein n=1 Tax=Rhizobium sp. BK591 TaxID=2586985 RepID=UPI0017C633D6|nr:hypothetical protein [Rhizobium sp. BK591]MBB3747031.1 hypothetical protein [Rhizobium sp. BK591]